MFWDADKAMIYRNNELVQKIDIPHAVNGFEYQIEACMLAIEEGKSCSDVMTHHDSIGVLKVMDNIRQQIGLQYPGTIELV